MAVKLLILLLSFVLYQSVLSQVIESPMINGNHHLNDPLNNVHWLPNQFFSNRPSSPVNPDEYINRPNWITGFPNQFPFNNNRLNHGLMPFNLATIRPMHHHMINVPSQSNLGTSILEEYLNRLTNIPSPSVTDEKTNWNNLNRPTDMWYRPHGIEGSVGHYHRPSNDPYQTSTENALMGLNPGPIIGDQTVNAMNHEHDSSSTSKPPEETQEDPASDENPKIDIRGNFDS